jgi:hypothetical protein
VVELDNILELILAALSDIPVDYLSDLHITLFWPGFLLLFMRQ